MLRMIWSYIMKWGWDYNREVRPRRDLLQSTLASNSSQSDVDLDRSRALNFTLFPASGGQILQFTGKYDQKLDRHERRLYIIRDDEDFSKQVAQFVTLELMRG